jgi:type IV secretion system protein VirB9
VLRFAYPAQPKDSAAALAGINSEEAALASGATPADPAALNFAWSRKGKATLMPSRIYDDGTSVYLSWVAGEAIPAILIKDATGAEGPVNYAVRGEVIVIEGLPQQIVLRSGKDSAVLDRATTPLPRGDVGARAALADAANQQGN